MLTSTLAEKRSNAIQKCAVSAMGEKGSKGPSTLATFSLSFTYLTTLTRLPPMAASMLAASIVMRARPCHHQN